MSTAATFPVVAALNAHRYRYTEEAGLQDGVAEVLTAAGVAFVREHPLGAAGRIDFYLPAERLGIEIKAGRSGGGPSAVARQLVGYADHADVDELLVISPRQALNTLPRILRGKPLHVIVLWANGL